jgi:hypothetical protein
MLLQIDQSWHRLTVKDGICIEAGMCCCAWAMCIWKRGVHGLLGCSLVKRLWLWQTRLMGYNNLRDREHARTHTQTHTITHIKSHTHTHTLTHTNTLTRHGLSVCTCRQGLHSCGAPACDGRDWRASLWHGRQHVPDYLLCYLDYLLRIWRLFWFDVREYGALACSARKCGIWKFWRRGLCEYVCLQCLSQKLWHTLKSA